LLVTADPPFRKSVWIVVDVEKGEAVLVRVRHGLEQDGVNDAEDGGVGADSEGEGENGDGGETAAAIQLTQCVTNILAKLAHEGCLSMETFCMGAASARPKRRAANLLVSQNIAL
jgi:hypothetical protein